jgi:hypothetical protein
VRPAPFVALLAGLLLAQLGHASLLPDGTVLRSAGASFLDQMQAGGTWDGLLSLDDSSFQSISSAGRRFGALHAAAKPARRPETYAMLLAGLGLFGWIARRRTIALRAPA